MAYFVMFFIPTYSFCSSSIAYFEPFSEVQTVWLFRDCAVRVVVVDVYCFASSTGLFVNSWGSLDVSLRNFLSDRHGHRCLCFVFTSGPLLNGLYLFYGNLSSLSRYHRTTIRSWFSDYLEAALRAWITIWVVLRVIAFWFLLSLFGWLVCTG